MSDNEAVTYKTLFTWLIVSGAAWASVVVSLGWFAWEVHSSQPHIGAVDHRELDQVIRRIDSIESKIDILIDRKGIR